jgi:two-component system sensor histidine kinase TctE
MRRFWVRESLQKQLIGWVLLPLVGVLVANGYGAYELAIAEITRIYDLGLYDNGLDLIHQVVVAPSGLSLNLPLAAQQMLQDNNGDSVAYVAWNDKGGVFSGKADLLTQAISPPLDIPWFRDRTIAGVPERVMYLTHQTDGHRFTLAVAETIHGRLRRQEDLFARLVLPEMGLFLVSVIILGFGMRRALAPVDHLREQISQRSSDYLERIDETTTPLELIPVVHGINELLARLEHSFQGQRRFIADAAHQLRTPLAVLSNQLQLAYAHPPVDIQSFVKELSITTERTVHLAHQLLTLARLEHTFYDQLVMSEVDVSLLFQDIVLDFMPEIERQHLDLVFDLESAPLKTQALLLREMLTNLFDNAIRYTPSYGRIRVSYQKDKTGEGAITISDSGPGVTDEEWPLLGRPFQRMVNSRPMGCGLGLAISMEIARALGATLTFTKNRDEAAGFTALVRLADMTK